MNKITLRNVVMFDRKGGEIDRFEIMTVDQFQLDAGATIGDGGTVHVDECGWMTPAAEPARRHILRPGSESKLAHLCDRIRRVNNHADEQAA